MSSTDRLPVIVLTGFLGSGKTTLLNRMLRDGSLRDAAVLVNEFGDVGIDHQLVRQSIDRVVVLEGGCICCAMREDVLAALRCLFEGRENGSVQEFHTIIIETTGLADPVPLLLTLQSSGLARERLSMPVVVTTVDAALHVATVAAHEQAARQIANADVVVITKTDLANQATVEEVRLGVRDFNPWCSILLSTDLSAGADRLVRMITERRSQDTTDGMRWLLQPQGKSIDWKGGRYTRIAAKTTHNAQSFAIALDEAVDWNAFGVWLTLLLHKHGVNILRVKGILNVAGLRGPVVMHASQHLVHPPEHLDQWPSTDRRSRLVFIVQEMEPSAILRSMKVFMKVAASVDSRGAPEAALSRPAGAGGTVRGRPVRRPTAPRWIRG